MEQEDDECCICFESKKLKPQVNTSCKHNFCLICFLKHLRKQNNCPCCRNPIMSDMEYKQLFPEESTIINENISLQDIPRLTTESLIENIIGQYYQQNIVNPTQTTWQPMIPTYHPTLDESHNIINTNYDENDIFAYINNI